MAKKHLIICLRSQPQRIKPTNNLTGQIFTRWTVLAYVGHNKFRVSFWLCRCKCGNLNEVKGSELTAGKSKSCGCFRIEFHMPTHFTHGKSHTVEYSTFQEAKKRCQNPNYKKYQHYGGRGIQFKFTSFEEFFKELGKKPSPDLSIDRIDNDGHYEKGNVRWATHTQQMNNRRPSSQWNYKNS